MFLMLCLLPVLAATPPPVKLASPGFNYVNVDEKTGELFAEYFARQLEAQGVPVVTAHEVAAVLGLERQKQLLGCSDESSSCLAELAGGLGVDGIIAGTLGKVGTSFTVTIKVLDAKDASSMAVYSAREKDEDAVFEWLSATAKDLAQKLAPGAPRAEEPKTSSLRSKAWIPGVAGGVLALAGGASLFQAQRYHQQLVTGDAQAIRNPSELDAAVKSGETFQTAGVALLGVGAAALLTAGGFYVFGGEDAPVQGAAYVGADGAGFAVGGTF